LDVIAALGAAQDDNRRVNSPTASLRSAQLGMPRGGWILRRCHFADRCRGHRCRHASRPMAGGQGTDAYGRRPANQAEPRGL